MKKFQRLVVVLFALSTIASAQNKMLTLDDIFSPDTAKRVKFGGTPVFAQWAADGRSFKQVVNGTLMRVDALTGRAVPYFESGSLAAALQREGMRADEANVLASSATLQFNAGETAILINHSNDLWVFDTATQSLRRLTNNHDEEREADFSPDGRWVSFVRANNLYVVDTVKGGEKQLTRDGREGDRAIYNGCLDWVYEEELYGRGQKRGYWWSPDSKNIAFLRLDESPVPKFVITNDVPSVQVVETTFYPKAGDPNPLVRLGIADVGKTSLVPNAGRIPKIGERLPPSLLRVGDAVSFVDTSIYKPDDLLIARVNWSSDGTEVIYQALNREQTFLDLNSFEVSGKATRLIQETSPAWVEVYDNPVQMGSGDFVWQSARSGWRHLYLCQSNGSIKRQLTVGKWEIRSLYGVDENNGWVYFSATRDSYIGENVYRVRLAGGEPERLTNGNGWHAANFNKTFTHFVDNWSDATTPTQTRLYAADGKEARIIAENRVPALSQYKLSQPEFLNVTTRDGFVMEAMMISRRILTQLKNILSSSLHTQGRTLRRSQTAGAAAATCGSKCLRKRVTLSGSVTTARPAVKVRNRHGRFTRNLVNTSFAILKTA